MIARLSLAVSIVVTLAAGARADEPAPAGFAPEITSGDDEAPAYRAALERALEAHRSGQYTTARAEMETAHALSPSARTLRGLGIVALAQGDAVAAIGFLEAALAATDRALSDSLRSSVEDLIAHAYGQVATLSLPEGSQGVRFEVDGSAPQFHGGRLVLLAVGPHQIDVRSARHAPSTQLLELHAGERHTLHVAQLEPLPVVTATTTASTAPPAPYTPRRTGGVHAGTNRAVLGAGVALWAVAYARFANIVDECEAAASGGCSSAQAKRRYRDENVRVLSLTGMVATGVGASALLAAAVFDVTRWRRERRAGPVGVQLGLGVIRVSGSF